MNNKLTSNTIQVLPFGEDLGGATFRVSFSKPLQVLPFGEDLGGAIFGGASLGKASHAFLLWFLLFFLPPSVGWAQPTEQARTITFSQQIEVPALWFTTDALEQVYLVNKQNEVVKWTPTEGVKARFAVKQWGEVSTIDATNPFLVLVYFADFQHIVLLDRNLNLLTAIALFDLGFIAPSAVGISAQNELWVFDAATAELKKLATQNQVFEVQQTIPMPLLRGVKITQLLLEDAQLFVLAPEEGIYILDIFGNLIQKIDIKAIQYFQVFDKQIIYKDKKNTFWAYHQTSFTTKEIKLPAALQQNQLLRIGRNHIFALQEEKIHIFNF